MNKAIKDLESCQDRAAADALLREACSIVDKAVKKKIIHKNNASNKKSKLAAFVKNLSE
jgi:small subunit ribosomal protein S20